MQIAFQHRVSQLRWVFVRLGNGNRSFSAAIFLSNLLLYWCCMFLEYLCTYSLQRSLAMTDAQRKSIAALYRQFQAHLQRIKDKRQHLNTALQVWWWWWRPQKTSDVLVNDSLACSIRLGFAVTGAECTFFNTISIGVLLRAVQILFWVDGVATLLCASFHFRHEFVTEWHAHLSLRGTIC